MPTARYRLGVAVIGDNLYGLGGGYEPGGHHATLESYGPTDTFAPTSAPTFAPSVTSSPTFQPTSSPSHQPTLAPTTVTPTALVDVCKLPSSFGSGTEPAAFNGCAPGAHLIKGAKCQLQCRSGFELLDGTSQYECTTGHRLIRATIQCRNLAESSCELPELADGVVGTESNGCKHS